MGVEVALSVGSLVFGVYSTMQQMEAQDEARAAQEQANEEQRKARAEQRAAQTAQSAAERRQQLREERVKRARLIQSGVNTGVSMSSGEMGAAGNLSTQLASNIGFNMGQGAASERISGYSQSAADFLSSANNSITEANQWGQAASTSLDIFSRAGGFNSIFPSSSQAPAPVRTATPIPVNNS